MKILIDINTGFCIGYGDQSNWPYDAPAIDINAQNFRFWKCNNLNDISNPASWVLSTPPPASISEVVDYDSVFCQSLIKLIFIQLREQNLTNAQRATLLTTIQTGLNALSWGDAQVARAAFNSIATTALWTQPRKDWVLLQLDNYLQ